MNDQTETVDEHPGWQLSTDNRETEDKKEGRPPKLDLVIDDRGVIGINLPENFSSELCTVSDLVILSISEILCAPESHR